MQLNLFEVVFTGEIVKSSFVTILLDFTEKFVKISETTFLLKMFSQKKVMQNLADLSGADFVDLSEASYSRINLFIEKWSSKSASNVKEKEEISKDYFWFLSEFWIYLLLLCLPLEVILRRWNVLFPSDTNISGVKYEG